MRPENGPDAESAPRPPVGVEPRHYHSSHDSPRPLSVLARFRRRFRHHAWVASALADAVAATPDPAALRALARALAADRVWWCRLTGAPADTEVWPDLTAEAVRQRAASTASDWRALLDGLTDDGLDRAVSYHNSRGQAFETAVADVLDHVLLHAAHHRGQANAALRAAGATPPTLDYIAWVRAL